MSPAGPPGDITVAAVQLAVEQSWQDPGLVKVNTERVLQRYRAVADEVDLAVFPELTLSGYIPLKGYDQRRKRVLAEVAQRVHDTELGRLRDATRGRRASLVVGYPEPTTMRNEFHNAVALVEDGGVRAVYRKIHLPVEENHYFVPGDAPVVAESRLGRIGLALCYDIFFPEVARLVALAGAEVLVVPSNWLDIANLRRAGEILPVARAMEGQLHVVFVNGVGELAVRGHEWSLYGRSRLVSATGSVVAEAGPRDETLVGVLRADDLAAGSDVFPLLRDRRPALYGPLSAPSTQFVQPPA